MGVGLRLQTRRDVLAQMVPHYRNAAPAQKKQIVHEFTKITGYHRKYAMRLLNHPEEGQPAPVQPHPSHYGSAVQEALVLAWNTMNRICAKRLIPFLPTLIEALERHGQVHLTTVCREQLLTMSAATADRLLRVHRGRGPHGLCTTRAGTLLKQQIPIRTFQQWDETQPGFLEADVVAHNGADRQGSFLYTLTLTDIATQWTECLPLLFKSQEAILDALGQVRELFPFPILGLDTDNGGEFINELLLSYCKQEQITFTRGRPSLKNDQCFIEQKNGHIVRQVVGYDRFVGIQAYQQLGEVYRALHLYINCFQPSMKLQEKQYDGRKVRLLYDGAKTPLQRLLLSKALSASKEHALLQMVQALDPVRLFEQVKDVQQALFVYTKTVSADPGKTTDIPLRRFCAERCTPGSPAANALPSDRIAEPHEKVETTPSKPSLLDWHRTCNDPFKHDWELIASWVLAHPERNSGELFRELQRLFPERYQPSHLRTFQRGIRKIRARLQKPLEEQWLEKVIHTDVPDRASSEKPEPEAGTTTDPVAIMLALTCNPCQTHAQGPALPPHLVPEEEETHPQRKATSTVVQHAPIPEQPNSQPSSPSESRTGTHHRRAALTIEQAIQDYREEQRKGKRRPKTLEWHQTALCLFQQYLLSQCQCVFITQITETVVRGWLTFLCETPTARGTLRSAGTMESYARSARAFCQWLVRRRDLKHTPFAHLMLPKVTPPLLHLLEPEEWERLQRACQSLEGKMVVTEQAAMRNGALLWVLAETGIRPCEACGLRISDVDREQGLLRVKGQGSKQRWVPLGQEGRRYLLRYLDHARFETATDVHQRRVAEEPLFVTETGRPLTDNGISLLFGRLRKRAGITRNDVHPRLLRDTFAVHYLQAGGDLFTLRDLLGQEESTMVKRSLRMHAS